MRSNVLRYAAVCGGKGDRRRDAVDHPHGGKPVSEITLWRYIQQTEKMIAQTCREGRKRLMRRHQVMRRNLFAKCVNRDI